MNIQLSLTSAQAAMLPDLCASQLSVREGIYRSRAIVAALMGYHAGTEGQWDSLQQTAAKRQNKQE
jgi:hypothetical protein